MILLVEAIRYDTFIIYQLTSVNCVKVNQVKLVVKQQEYEKGQEIEIKLCTCVSRYMNR